LTPERWEQLTALFHEALAQPAEARAAWLDKACPDEKLRREAIALIHAHETAGRFLEDPPILELSDVAGQRRLGPYIIRGELGRGGMGIVYLAEDVRLGRTVALKALPAALAADPRLRERLRREARAAAALSHPGIAVVYALEEIDGELFIASEHLRGHTLRDELANGPLSAERTLQTVIEIVRAVCAAHEAGVIHRDLKPENVLRTDTGQIKILDFGIATIASQEATRLTMAGAALGTPAYMAPEQLGGGPVDFRADHYAVGVLLVELATGLHPLATGARDAVPASFRAIAERCMRADPRERFASTRELLAALESAALDTHPSSVPQASVSPARAFSPRWWWEFHQGVAALTYWLMVIPAWGARTVIGGALGRTLFFAILAAVIVAANLRLHLWFTSRIYPGELQWVRPRVALWIHAADWTYSALLCTAGIFVGDASAALAILLIAVGIGSAVAFLLIEPATTRAAFRSS
jgi:hypothetical protein